MKASELGFKSTIYVLNKTNGFIDEFLPTFLVNDGKLVEIKNEDYHITVKPDFNFHEKEGLTFYFDEKNWLNALLPIQEKKVEKIKAELLQASNRLEKIKQEINKIENGI